MGIRLKIALGFVLLTITVVSLVSFWGAQSLGFTVDSSDYIYLEAIKNSVVKQLDIQNKDLTRLTKEVSLALETAELPKLIANSELNAFANKIMEASDVDYLEILIDQKPQINPNLYSSLIKNSKSFGRIANLGPLSFAGYVISQQELKSNKNARLIMAKKAVLDVKAQDVFCIYDSKGLLNGKGFIRDYSINELMSISNLNSTTPIKVGDELYRLRGFHLNESLSLIAGYSAQVATLARSEINSMILRLALLEILGFLVLGYFWGRKIFAPMKTLQASIDKVSEGQWPEIPQEITENSYEEIGRVAKSFNQMVKQLSSARENLIEAQKELATKDKMATLGRFSAGIAHEINNPLGTILMSAGMIKESNEKNLPIEQEDIETIVEEVKRCRDVIENLRTYTRKTEPNLISTSFETFFFSIKEALQKDFNRKGLILSFDFRAEKSTEVKVDKKAMLQVFNNLVKNAIEASDIETKIQIIAEETPNNCIIKVLDNGKGFDVNIEQIFEPMFTTKAQGTGLGLVICQAIVEGHQGQISATRLLEEGLTCFTISLPKINESKKVE